MSPSKTLSVASRNVLLDYWPPLDNFNLHVVHILLCCKGNNILSYLRIVKVPKSCFPLTRLTQDKIKSFAIITNIKNYKRN